MLIKSFEQNGINIDLYENVIFEGTSWEHTAYTVVAPDLQKSYVKLEDALEMFEQLTDGKGVLWN